jgi:hypothetical protein
MLTGSGMNIENSEESAGASFGVGSKALAIGSLICVVFGVKILLIQQFGSAVPFWDQWDAEANFLYKPYLNSNLSFAMLISAHNEHRILMSRLLSLALFELNGGWDPLLQMIANAVLHVGAIVLLVLCVQRIIRPGQCILLVSFSILVFALPIGWENLLAGFQSQFYLLLVFSFLALMGFSATSAFSITWWGSAACSVAAFFSMASGALTAAAAFVVVMMQIFLGVRAGVKEYVAAFALLVAAAVMTVFVPKVPGHDIYLAHGVAELLHALWLCLTFPQTNPYLGVLVNLPLAVYAVAILKVRPVRQSPHWIILGIAVWLFAQSLSISYGRSMLVLSSRYLDLIIIGLPINFGILLFAQHVFIGRRNVAMLMSIAWLFVVVPALLGNVIASSFPAMVEKGADGRAQLKNVLAYLRADDLTELQGKSSLDIPYPDPVRLGSLLSDPVVRLLLPDSIRPPTVDERQRLDLTLLKGRFRSFTAMIKDSVFSYADILIGIGVALAFGAGMVGHRGSTRSRLATLAD